MRPELFYLIGPPGVGKSTVMAYLCARTTRDPMTRPFAHDLLARLDGGYAVELGTVRPHGYSGTDALAMNVQPQALQWLRETEHTLVLGEGDRLGTQSFLSQAMAEGWHVHLAVFNAPYEILTYRRMARGSNQDPRWMKGRATKVRNVAEWARGQQAGGAPITVYELDAVKPASTLADALKLLVPPLNLLEAPIKAEGTE